MNRFIRGFLDRVGVNPYIFDFLQKICNCGDLREQVSLLLEAKPTDSVLDVGCGTGLYSTLAKGRYIGIDLNESYIKYARGRYKDKNKIFFVGDVTKLRLNGEMFDNILYLAMLHHFSEEDNILILKTISYITRKKVLILDLTLPDYPTFMQAFFLKVERGKYPRSLKDQLRIVEKVLHVGKASTFLNRSKFGLFSIIEAYPKDRKI